LTTPVGTLSTQAREPRIEDLLPLLFGEPDRRLDDIKQWIVNLDARAKQAGGESWRAVLVQFFDVIRELVPGTQLSHLEVDHASFDVTVRTDDGVISIDQLSQGMNSIIAWIGTVLQRLYDIYGDSPEPTSKAAVVLIDELDAHLHPSWQRLIPSLARRHLPNVQFLATAHSPLMAGGLKPGECFVARRELGASSSGEVVSVAVVEPVNVDTAGMRADQILTSPLFGMMTSRSIETEEDIEVYSGLLGKPDRTGDEEVRFQRLKSKLSRTLQEGETPRERSVEAMTSERVSTQLSALGQLSTSQRARLLETGGELEAEEGNSE